MKPPGVWLRCAALALIAPALLAAPAVAQQPETARAAYLLEANGYYAKAARLRLKLASQLIGYSRFDNLALAGADKYESRAPCEAVKLWRQALRGRQKPVYPADASAIKRAYPLAFRQYSELFAGDVIPANGVFIDNGAVSSLKRALDAASKGRKAEAFQETDKAMATFPVFRWALLIQGDLYDSSGQYEKAASDWLTALRTEEAALPDSAQIEGAAFVALEMLYHRTAARCGS